MTTRLLEREMMSFKIDKDVPIPTAKYPFHYMKVGDSFLFPLVLYATIQTNSRKFAKRNNARFMVRKVSDTEGRVWRIK